jgi:glycosyltransferase involved in cell wall biosynthesis
MMQSVSDICETLPPGAVLPRRQAIPEIEKMRGQVLAILLDSAPQSWTSREEMHLRFSRALIAQGVQPVFVFSEDPVKEVREKLRYNGAEIAPSINYEKGRFAYYRRLGQIIKYHSVTAVHIAFFDYFSLVAWMARLHGVHHITYHERNSGALRARSWKRVLLRLRSRITTQPISRVVAISEYIKQRLVECGVRESKIVVVHNGIDPRRFLPDRNARARLLVQFSIEPREMIIGLVCYLRPFKNPQVVVEALAQLQERSIAARLIVAGDGEMRSDLEVMSRTLGIFDRIHWLGDVQDPVPLLQGCDIYVMASVGEAFGLALAEAMACGAPVIASRSGSFPEIIEDGESGLLVRPLDATALADAIEKLAKDESLRRRLARNGVERVSHHFTVEASIQKMLNVYGAMWSC